MILQEVSDSALHLVKYLATARDDDSLVQSQPGAEGSDIGTRL